MDKPNIPHSSKNDDPARSNHGEAPADPSNTSNIGQPTEQGIISKREGITEQSSEWEKTEDADANIPGEGDNSIEERVEQYLKNPSPEERAENS